MAPEESLPPPGDGKGTERPLRQLRDPRTMRAIAHPTRLALLEALGHHERLTATEAAEIIGESPTNCAFHLRTLAKYGFVEEAGDAPGRRRPWRLRNIGFAFNGTAEDAETASAAEALTRLLWDTWLGRAGVVNARRAGFHGTWQQVTSAQQTVAYMTPDEADQFMADLGRLLGRYRDRLENPALRPPDGLPIELLLFSYPLDATNSED
ncbi:winged helix-turn-helix domain-containing protein [Kitasatospora sp. GP82]|uniref:ArsR/SmtB family transcription factor n=1 Tax=Kitasatospora sp. GP82 TaxID=3035089 RepID=UPI002473DDE5|nr:winged helix-turn-helix domain-containing protein [Kitasatospora sp. GP82]MDH6125759.1 DNA-binding transcriptional ArsR family regulator [Kitasatospora sp. GP82]